MAMQFAHAGGVDWRRATGALIDQLEPCADPSAMGLVYMSGDCAALSDAVTAAMIERTGVRRWRGSSSEAVIAGSRALEGSAIAAAILPGATLRARDALADPLPAAGCWIAHASGDAGEELTALADDARRSGATLLGMIAPETAHPALIGAAPASEGVDAFSLPSATLIAHGRAEGCARTGPWRRANAAFGAWIAELDGEPATKALEAEFGDLIVRDFERKRGFACALEPIGETDDRWRARPIAAIDRERGSILLGGGANAPARIAFGRRDGATATADLEALALRIENALAGRRPSGAIYWASEARRSRAYAPGPDELRRLRAAIGGAALIGAYGGGEICEGRTHALSGVLAVLA